MQMMSFTVKGNTGGGPSLGKREERVHLVLNLSFKMAEGHPNGDTKIDRYLSPELRMEV